jgi:hypothetical protein
LACTRRPSNRHLIAGRLRQCHKGLGDIFGRVDDGSRIDALTREIRAMLKARRVDEGGKASANVDVGEVPELLAKARLESPQPELLAV